jgi:hypothetical protein
MDKVAKSLPQKHMVSDICTHYWVIESPMKTTSNGICKLCGCERQFINSFENLRYAAFRERKSKSKEEYALMETLVGSESSGSE